MENNKPSLEFRLESGKIIGPDNNVLTQEQVLDLLNGFVKKELEMISDKFTDDMIGMARMFFFMK